MTTDGYRQAIEAIVSRNCARIGSGRPSQYQRRTGHLTGQTELQRLRDKLAALEAAKS
jgi:hypothetical protein